MQHKVKIILLFFLFFTIEAAAQDIARVTAKPRSGDGVYTLLRRYELFPLDQYAGLFKELNSAYYSPGDGLKLHHHYVLPIRKFVYDGKTIRSTLGISEYDTAKIIQDYNEKMHGKGLRGSDYKEDLELWLPEYLVAPENISNIPEDALPEKVIDMGELSSKPNTYPIFGPDYEKTEPLDSKLSGCVFYLVAGHGGPDPGAIGKKDGHELCEDEYAYDVTLRLARNLLERGAKVYLIVRDPDDGIRDDAYLICDSDEYYFGGDTISHDQLIRLTKRAEIVNKFFEENKVASRDQAAVVIHVDSRSVGKRIDIFFYHHDGSTPGEKLASNLQETIRQKYAAAQPGRGYHGTVKTRDLFMLRKTFPPTVFLELGNIRNRADQRRFIITNNRQAMANWICDGLIEIYGK